jgi:SAM-dependent methyltransferase
MGTTAEHYERLLADCYSWMLGDFDARVERERAFLLEHGVSPAAGAEGGARVAVDLGAGSGHQAVALARLGWTVRAIDFSAKLLGELRRRTAGLDVAAIEDDLRWFPRHLTGPAGAVLCLGDTLTHLASTGEVRTLFADARRCLAPGGALVLTFRDLSRALDGTERFIPVRSDEDTILTCFLEYLPATVRVHDLLHRRRDGAWQLATSAYEKLRLAVRDVEAWVMAAGFALAHTASTRGLVEIVARIPG